MGGRESWRGDHRAITPQVKQALNCGILQNLKLETPNLKPYSGFALIVSQIM